MLTFHDLYKACQESPEGLEFIKKMTANSAIKLEVELLNEPREPENLISVTSDNCKTPFPIFFFPIATQFAKIPTNHFTVTVNDANFDVYYFDNFTGYKVLTEDPLTGRVAFSEYLKDTFSAVILNEKKESPRFTKQEIMSYIQGRDIQRTYSQMVTNLEKHNGEFCDVFYEPEAGFEYDKPIAVKELFMLTSQWVTLEHLKLMDCSTIELTDSSITNEDMNAYIHYWLKGSNTKLEQLRIGRSWDYTPGRRFAPNLSIIAGGLKTLPGTDKKHLWTDVHRKEPFEFEKGLDVVRESDGALATLLIVEDCGCPKYFVFNVWGTPKNVEEEEKKPTGGYCEIM